MLKSTYRSFATTTGNGGASDPLVVATAELSVIVNRWVNEFRADHPPLERNEMPNSSFGQTSWVGDYRNASNAVSQPQMGAIEKLGQMINQDTGVLRKIMKVKTKTTSLDLADRILQAIERTDALHNGELHIIPNPRWSQEKWLEWKRGCENDF